MNGYSDSDLVWVTCAYCRRNKFRVLKTRAEQNNYCGMHCRDSGIVGGYRWKGNNLPMESWRPNKQRARPFSRKPGRKPKELANEIEREIADGAPPPGEEEGQTRLEQIKEIEQEVDTLDILSHQRELS